MISLFQKIIKEADLLTDQPTDRPTYWQTDQRIDRRGHREVTLPIKGGNFILLVAETLKFIS